MATTDELTQRVRDRHSRDVERIRNLHSTHPAARRVHIARATQQALSDMSDLETADRERRIAQAAISDDSAWRAGAGTDMGAWRDARNQAAKYLGGDYDRARRDMVDAESAGDAPMVAAVGREAARRASEAADGERSRWYPVAEAYLKARDERGERPAPALHESQGQNMVNLYDATERRASGGGAEIMHRAARFRLGIPDELPRDRWEIDRIAQADPEDAARQADRARVAHLTFPRR